MTTDSVTPDNKKSVLPTISALAFTRLCLGTLIALAVLIVSGGAVRLTGSGLGCPDWPNCQQYSFTAPLAGHQGIEFGNRVLSTVATILVIATALCAFRLSPRRRDLLLPALGLAGGIIAQIVIGGLVVIYHLWPPLVMVHFGLSEAMVGLALVLYLRSRREPGSPVAMVGSRFVTLGRLLVGAAAGVMAVGTAVTGAGPNSGSTGSKRLPVTFRSITELHSTLAAVLVGLAVATLFATWIAGAPEAVVSRSKLLIGAIVVQGSIGYAQYFLKVPAGLVILHLAGATALLLAVLSFYIGLFVVPGDRTDRRDDPDLQSKAEYVV